MEKLRPQTIGKIAHSWFCHPLALPSPASVCTSLTPYVRLHGYYDCNGSPARRVCGSAHKILAILLAVAGLVVVVVDTLYRDIPTSFLARLTMCVCVCGFRISHIVIL